VAAIAALAAATIILSVITLELLAERQSLGRRQDRLQAEWLARAGLELAADRLLEKPAAFTEDNRELLPDARVRVTVEQEGSDVYAVTAEAEVGSRDRMVVRTAHARFRRTASGGAVRLDTLPAKVE
jgi:hypothetical protein